VELKNLSFAYMDVAGGAPSGGAPSVGTPSRCGVPIRRPGKGREQDAVSFTHRLSEHFYIADFQALGNQELA
jgi:hypothetical protein